MRQREKAYEKGSGARMISRNVFGVMPLAAEGDWKVAALNAVINAMGEGASSFIEAYTYDFAKDNTYSLGAHMLEVNPKIAAETPRIEVHPLGTGGKDAPARLGFEAKAGHATFSFLISIISANTTPMSITGERNNQQNAVFLKKSLSIKAPKIRPQNEVRVKKKHNVFKDIPGLANFFTSKGDGRKRKHQSGCRWGGGKQ